MSIIPDIAEYHFSWSKHIWAKAYVRYLCRSDNISNCSAKAHDDPQVRSANCQEIIETKPQLDDILTEIYSKNGGTSKPYNIHVYIYIYYIHTHIRRAAGMFHVLD